MTVQLQFLRYTIYEIRKYKGYIFILNISISIPFLLPISAEDVLCRLPEVLRPHFGNPCLNV